jgi:hypothetical protein
LTDDGPHEPTASWHPKIRCVHEYWLRIHPGTGNLPGRQHFDPLAVRPLLPNLWMLDVQRDPLRFRYRLAGTRIVEAAGVEPTGEWLDDAHPNVRRHPEYLDRYRAVVREGKPRWRRGRARLWTNRDYREIENVILPFSADGAQVDLLVMLTVLYRPDGSSE